VTPSRARLLFGTDEPVAATVRLRAGPLSLAFRAGRLWHISAGGVEIWHGVAFLYRDADWGTPEPVVDRCESTLSAYAFRIRCIGHFPTKPRIDFHLDLEGTSAGVIRVAGEAVPRGDIATNRIGLCVMHPMAAGGRRVDVQHVDGRTSRSTFPTLIPPWPPFMLVRAIRHEYAPRRWARCTLDGDAFELEDQRNNSDASFKTYNRSNMMARPYALPGRVPIRQSVELVLETSPPRARARREGTETVRVGNDARDLPPIGIQISATDAAADEAMRAALRALRPAHLHLAVEPDEPVDWNGIADLLETAHANLRLDVELTDAARARPVLQALRDDLRRARIMPEGVAVFPSDQQAIALARRTFPRARIGGGTPYFFVQLNRAERLGASDFLTFTTSPIVHGTDEEAVMASLTSLPSMLATLQARYPGIPVRIGPSTIAARNSPLGRQPESDGTRRIALARRDPRGHGIYGAAWLLGYIAQLATTGVEALTLMGLSGDCGVVEAAGRGGVRKYPPFHLLACLQGALRGPKVSVSNPARVAALAIDRGARRELLLANLTGARNAVEITGIRAARISVMDARSWRSGAVTVDVWRSVPSHGTGMRVVLDAYAVARVMEQE